MLKRLCLLPRGQNAGVRTQVNVRELESWCSCWKFWYSFTQVRSPWSFSQVQGHRGTNLGIFSLCHQNSSYYIIAIQKIYKCALIISSFSIKIFVWLYLIFMFPSIGKLPESCLCAVSISSLIFTFLLFLLLMAYQSNLASVPSSDSTETAHVKVSDLHVVKHTKHVFPSSFLYKTLSFLDFQNNILFWVCPPSITGHSNLFCCCCFFLTFFIQLLLHNTSSVFLPWESHEQYEKAKKIELWKMNSPGW